MRKLFICIILLVCVANFASAAYVNPLPYSQGTKTQIYSEKHMETVANALGIDHMNPLIKVWVTGAQVDSPTRDRGIELTADTLLRTQGKVYSNEEMGILVGLMLKPLDEIICRLHSVFIH
ncbi:MAG: hypothetical protein LBV40_02010 [Methanomicrobiales archaeon]|jgi:hypothetical protein|nr:hypothetical protein [Methanomicrobiales archaeon]